MEIVFKDVYLNMNPEQQNLYARLMAKHNRDLCSYVYTLHPNLNDLDDIIQELAIKIYKNFEKYDSERPFLPWAFKFASFEVLSFRRDQARSRLVFTDELLETMIEERSNMQEELELKRQQLRQCILKLESEDQRLLDWRYHSDKSIKEMAAALHIPVKRLYKRLEKLRLTLFQCINFCNT